MAAAFPHRQKLVVVATTYSLPLSSFLVLSFFFLVLFCLILFSSILRLSGDSNNRDTVVLRSYICPLSLSMVELDYTSQH